MNLRKERNWAISTLQEIKHEPVAFELTPAGGHVREWWRKNVASCDILLLLIDQEVSAPVFDEVETARKCGVRIFVYAKHEKCLLAKDSKGLRNLGLSENDFSRFCNFVSNQKLKIFEKRKDLNEQIMASLASLPVRSYSIPEYLVVENGVLDRIKMLYVPPTRKYEDALDILESGRFLIVIGPPHVGKTSMAYFLLSTLKEKYNLDVIARCTEYRDMSLLQQQRNLGILIDDPFGRIKYETTSIGQYVDEIYKRLTQDDKNADNPDTAKKNYIVVTSRENVFGEALENTKVNEIPRRNIVQILQEGDYSTDDLTRILENHLNYYMKKNMISEQGVAIARANSSRIVKALRFPHNIDFFVENFLKDLTSKDLDASIEKAGKIKEEVEKWYGQLDEDIELKLFVFTAALLPDSEPSVLEGIYKSFISDVNRERSMRLSKPSINQLRYKCNVYITEVGLINFKHPSYLEGVIGRIRKAQSDDLVLFLKCIRPMMKSFSPFVSVESQRLAITVWDMIHILRISANILPDYSLPMVIDLMSEAKERNILPDIFGIVRQIGQVDPASILPLLEKFAIIDDYDIRKLTISAIESIGKADPYVVLDSLGRLATSKAWWLKPLIASVLQKIGSDNPDIVLPLLEELATEGSRYGQSDAIEALINLGHMWPTKIMPALDRVSKKRNGKSNYLIEWLTEELRKIQGNSKCSLGPNQVKKM
jgi:hypothetical protein